MMPHSSSPSSLMSPYSDVTGVEQALRTPQSSHLAASSVKHDKSYDVLVQTGLYPQ